MGWSSSMGNMGGKKRFEGVDLDGGVGEGVGECIKTA